MTTRFNLRNRVPVEPLSSERLTNIERSIVAGAPDAARAPTRESRNLVPAFALATVLMLGAGLVGWQLRGGGAPEVVAASEPLLVKTLDSSSTIDIGDAKITSSPATAFVVTRPDGGVLVSLGGGRVGLEVGKRVGRAPLVVRAGDTDVVVVGTRFSVDYDAAKHTVDVRVTEGIVKVVHRNGEPKQLVAGEAWTTERGLVALAALETHLEDIEIDVGDPPDIKLQDRTAKVPDARITTNGATKPPTGGEVRSGSGKKPSLVDPSDPYVELKNAILRVKVLRPAKVDTTDPHGAISEYQKTLTGPGASHALYSVAFVQYAKLNRAGDALHTLDRYRSRFQDGDEYASALWLRVRILCTARIDDACRAAAHTYIGATTEGRAREVAERITESPR